jgi:hypothetical protein
MSLGMNHSSISLPEHRRRPCPSRFEDSDRESRCENSCAAIRFHTQIHRQKPIARERRNPHGRSVAHRSLAGHQLNLIAATGRDPSISPDQIGAFQIT